MMRYLKAFGWFCWDFLAGDAPEIAVGTLLILSLALLAQSAGLGAGIVILAGTALVLTASVWWGRRK